MKFSLARRVCAEFLGTCFLVTAVVGSGIMGERLSGGNIALALLANSIATGAALITLILVFGAVSGAHFNPLVTLANASWAVSLAPMFFPTALRNWPAEFQEPSVRISCLACRQSRCRVTSEAVPLNSTRRSLPLSG